MVVRLNPSGVWQPRDRGFHMLVACSEGRPVFFTGQVAWDEHETIVGPGDVSAQTRQCFHNIERLLGAVGGTLADVVELRTYYTAREQLPLIQEVRSEFLQPATAPASTSVMVAGLGHPDFLVELTPVAIIPHDRFTG